MPWYIAPFVAVSILVSPSFAQQSPTASTVTYDTFCGKTRIEKQDLFKTMTAEQKAMLWQTQIDRWRDLNSSRLTADQKTLLQEFRAIIPAAVVRPLAPDTQPKLQALEARLGAAFSKDQLRELDNYGPCLTPRAARGAGPRRGGGAPRQ